MTKKEMFAAWLNDAYAMEYGAADLLKRYADDMEKYPEVRMAFNSIAEKAEEKANRLKAVIERLGANVSTAKTLIGKIGSVWQSATSELTHDQPVKHLLVVYSGAHLGIASYTSLAAAARDLGETEVVTLAEECISFARERAEWIRDQIPMVTSKFLREEHTD